MSILLDREQKKVLKNAKNILIREKEFLYNLQKDLSICLPLIQDHWKEFNKMQNVFIYRCWSGEYYSNMKIIIKDKVLRESAGVKKLFNSWRIDDPLCIDISESLKDFSVFINFFKIVTEFIKIKSQNLEESLNNKEEYLATISSISKSINRRKYNG